MMADDLQTRGQMLVELITDRQLCTSIEQLKADMALLHFLLREYDGSPTSAGDAFKIVDTAFSRIKENGDG